MITDEDKLAIITKVRNEIIAGLRLEERRRFEADIRLSLAAVPDEQKVVLLDNEIALKARAEPERERV